MLLVDCQSCVHAFAAIGDGEEVGAMLPGAVVGMLDGGTEGAIAGDDGFDEALPECSRPITLAVTDETTTTSNTNPQIKYSKRNERLLGEAMRTAPPEERRSAEM